MIGFHVSTGVDQDSRIVSTIEAECSYMGDGPRDMIMRTVIDTLDAQTRKALIDLGWTPP